MERFLRVRPEVIAHDLHPDYSIDALRPERGPAGDRSASSITTRTWPARWPSTGSPARSSAWPTTAPAMGPTARRGAARLLVADYAGFERLATLSPAPARRRRRRDPRAVADRARRCSTTPSTGDPPLDALRLFRGIPPNGTPSWAPDARSGASTRRWRTASAATSTRSERSCSSGRSARYEGQIALAWNLIAARGELRPLRVRVRRDVDALRARPAPDGACRLVVGSASGGPPPLRSSRRAFTTRWPPPRPRWCAPLGSARAATGRAHAAAASRTRASPRACGRLCAASLDRSTCTAEFRRATAASLSDRRWSPMRVATASRVIGNGVVHVPWRSGQGASTIDGLIATVDFWGVRKQVRLDVVDEPVAPGRLRPEPRRLRHPAHPRRGDRRDAGAVRAAAARAEGRGPDGRGRPRRDCGQRRCRSGAKAAR